MNYTVNNKIYIFLFLFFFFSCVTEKYENKRVNMTVNESYKSSVKTFIGELSKEDYLILKNNIEKELNVVIPEGKKILINYYQKGANCFDLHFDKQTQSMVMDNSIRLSNKFCSQNNAVGYFVNSRDCFQRDIIAKKNIFIEDSGFFSNVIFTLKENCRSFFILKPNGMFIKHYGGDYYTEVDKYLKN
ncbi:MAG: hypothetical protein ACOVMH_03195 [Flavobacterium sp.]